MSFECYMQRALRCQRCDAAATGMMCNHKIKNGAGKDEEIHSRGAVLYAQCCGNGRLVENRPTRVDCSLRGMR
jgi:hypothetical protein